MAERKLEVKILGDSRDLERAFGRASGSAKKFDRNMSGLGRAASGLAKGFAVAAAGVTAIAVVGARELQEQAKVSAQTAVVLRNVAKSAGITTKQVEAMAGALQSSTGAADDQIQSASNVILRFGLITKTGKAAEGQLRELTTTALDLSVATGKDLNASAQALGRALASPEKAAGALRRAGIVLTTQQREQIKTMTEAGNVAGAQAMVLGLVQSRVKGASAEFGKTLPGQVERAKRSLEDLSENTLAALAPALSKIVPVLVKAVQGIAPVIAQVGTIVAQVADDLISNPAFQEFARTLRDIAVQGVQVLAGALRAVLPIVVAILAPVAALAGALLRSRTAMTVLTAAFAAFVALKATAYITGLVSAFRSLAITQTAASSMRALTTATSALAFGFRGVSAQAVGLAPGLTAAAGGVTRMGVAANAAKGIVPALGRALSGALGGPVGIAVGATAALAAVIGGDLIGSFMRSKDPAQRYADAMAEAAGATEQAKDSLAGLSDAMNGVGDAQDRTREATANRVKLERELLNLEQQGITTGPQHAAVVRNLAAARRDESRAMGEQRGAADTLKAKQTEVTGVMNTLVGGLARAAGEQRSLANGMYLGVRAGTVSKDAYAAFLGTVNTKIMGSQELSNFRQRAAEMAGEFRAQGTPQAQAMARALDGISKARTPDAVKTYAGQIVKLMGGSQADVKRITDKINANMGKVGDVEPATSWKTKLLGYLSDVEGRLRTLFSLFGSGPKGGKGSNQRRSNERVPMSGAPGGTSEDAFSWFFGTRSSAAGAVSGLQSLASERFYATDKTAQEITERRKQRAKDLADLEKSELEKRRDQAETADERKRAEIDLQEFIDAQAWQGVEDRARTYEQDIENLQLQFDRGAISAQTFQTELTKLLGGDPGETMGKNFGERWKAAFETVFGPVAALINQGFGGATGTTPVQGPPAPPEAPPPENAAGMTYDEWRKKRGDFIRALESAKKGKGGFTKDEKRAFRLKYGADDLAEWMQKNPQPARAALGGITRGLTIAGEAGAEAIIPLTGSRGVSYMARVMEEASRRSSGGNNVVVNFYGVLDAREAARRIKPEIDRIVSLA